MLSKNRKKVTPLLDLLPTASLWLYPRESPSNTNPLSDVFVKSMSITLRLIVTINTTSSYLNMAVWHSSVHSVRYDFAFALLCHRQSTWKRSINVVDLEWLCLHLFCPANWPLIAFFVVQYSNKNFVTLSQLTSIARFLTHIIMNYNVSLIVLVFFSTNFQLLHLPFCDIANLLPNDVSKSRECPMALLVSSHWLISHYLLINSQCQSRLRPLRKVHLHAKNRQLSAYSVKT